MNKLSSEGTKNISSIVHQKVQSNAYNNRLKSRINKMMKYVIHYRDTFPLRKEDTKEYLKLIKDTYTKLFRKVEKSVENAIFHKMAESEF